MHGYSPQTMLCTCTWPGAPTASLHRACRTQCQPIDCQCNSCTRLADRARQYGSHAHSVVLTTHGDRGRDLVEAPSPIQRAQPQTHPPVSGAAGSRGPLCVPATATYVPPTRCIEHAAEHARSLRRLSAASVALLSHARRPPPHQASRDLGTTMPQIAQVCNVPPPTVYTPWHALLGRRAMRCGWHGFSTYHGGPRRSRGMPLATHSHLTGHPC